MPLFREPLFFSNFFSSHRFQTNYDSFNFSIGKPSTTLIIYLNFLQRRDFPRTLVVRRTKRMRWIEKKTNQKKYVDRYTLCIIQAKFTTPINHRKNYCTLNNALFNTRRKVERQSIYLSVRIIFPIPSQRSV